MEIMIKKDGIRDICIKKVKFGEVSRLLGQSSLNFAA